MAFRSVHGKTRKKCHTMSMSYICIYCFLCLGKKRNFFVHICLGRKKEKDKTFTTTGVMIIEEYFKVITLCSKNC